jgi:hypothetical protein
MKLNDFVKKLYSDKGNYGNVVSVSSHYDHQIIENAEGEFFVNGILAESVDSLDEAKRYVEVQELASKTKIKLYEDISETKLAGIIKKHHDTKITTKLVESYLTLASSKVFTIDPVLLEMRTTYKTSNIFEDKIDFKLNDGKQVAISEETVTKIATLLNKSNHKEEIIEYMRESTDNFLAVVRQL